MRLNPDIDAKTHVKISTGHAESKFGIPWSRAREAYALARTLKNVEIAGVDVHIGSQITQLAPFEAAFTRVVEFVGQLRRDGYTIARIDLGGGLAVPYRTDNEPPPEPIAYGAMVARLTKNMNAQLILEPGRMIAANAGVLVARVIYDKTGERKHFLILDAGMNDLMRPALYDAYHDVVPVEEPKPGAPRIRYDVVGPICETTDIFAADRDMPRLKDGDLVAILTTGAYGAVMASAYNARPPAAEVLVKGAEWAVVRPRMDDDALIATDRIPHWLD